MNMSYCRFHNTNLDLDDCIYALNDLNEGEDTISRDEFIQMKNLLRGCIEFIEFFTPVDVDEDEIVETLINLEDYVV